ncbi:MAG: tetratricopeptide repeat protein, partial [Sphingobacteriales bacterium]
MASRKSIQSDQHYHAARDLEKSGDHAGAIKLYQKAVKTDPLNIQAWNRQMILYRKSKSREDEVRLIKTAISEYKKQTEGLQQQWLQENKAKVESSRDLAKVLGLVESNGTPLSNDTILEKWQTRLYLLGYRLKNARKKTSKKLK